METNHCSNCGAIINKTKYCHNCGQKTKENNQDQVETKNLELEKKEQDSFGVKSIKSNEKEDISFYDKNEKALRRAVVSVLVIFVVGIASLYYYRLGYYSPDKYVSPVVLSSRVVADSILPEVKGDNFEDNNGQSKLLEQDLNLIIKNENSNLSNLGLFAYVSPKSSLNIHTENFDKVYNKYIDKDNIEELYKAFDTTEEDFNKYVNEEFTIVYPGSTLNEWGVVLNLTDKDYVGEKIKFYEQNKSKLENEIIDDLYLDIEDITYIETIQNDDGEAEENEVQEYFLLVASTKEFLDQMKENGEGNIDNLQNNALFKTTRDLFAEDGFLYVYEQNDAAWEAFVDIIYNDFDYEGLDKWLKAKNQTGKLFINEGDKIRLITTDY